MAEQYTIGDIVDLTGFHPSTIRRYVYTDALAGLLSVAYSSESSGPGRPTRLFNEQDLALIRVVARLHEAGALHPQSARPLLSYLRDHPDLGQVVHGILIPEETEEAPGKLPSYLRRPKAPIASTAARSDILARLRALAAETQALLAALDAVPVPPALPSASLHSE